MLEIIKNNKTEIYYENRFIGFIQKFSENSYGYSFSKPNSPSYIMFYVESKGKARQRIIENDKTLKDMFKRG